MAFWEDDAQPVKPEATGKSTFWDDDAQPVEAEPGAETGFWENDAVSDPAVTVNKPIPFDPEGQGYDYQSAMTAGILPDETGHWASRDPRTGLLLKGRSHETWNKTLTGEEEAGYEVYQGEDGRYYSRQKALETSTGKLALREAGQTVTQLPAGIASGAIGLSASLGAGTWEMKADREIGQATDHIDTLQNRLAYAERRLAEGKASDPETARESYVPWWSAFSPFPAEVEKDQRQRQQRYEQTPASEKDLFYVEDLKQKLTEEQDIVQKAEVRRDQWRSVRETMEEASQTGWLKAPENMSTTAWVFRTIGQAVPSIGAAYAMAPVSPWAGAAMLGHVQGMDQYFESRAAGMSVDEANRLYALELVLSTAIEHMPIGHLSKLKGGPLKRFIVQGTVESVEEVIDTLKSNWIAKGSYDKDRDMLLGTLTAAVGGFGAGAPGGAMTAISENRANRSQPGPNPTPSEPAPASTNIKGPGERVYVEEQGRFGRELPQDVTLTDDQTKAMNDAGVEVVTDQSGARFMLEPVAAQPAEVTDTTPTEKETPAAPPLKKGETVYLTSRKSGVPYKNQQQVTVVQVIDENTVRIERGQKYEEVQRSQLSEASSKTALRKRGEYLAGLSKEERSQVRKADRELNQLLENNLHFFPEEAHQEVMAESDGKAVAQATARWMKSARDLAARELGMEDADMNDPRARAELLPKLKEWMDGPGRQVMAEDSLNAVRMAPPTTVNETDLDHGDLVFADGGWYLVNKESGQAATRLEDGTDVDLDDFESTEVQGVLKPGDKAYQAALQAFNAQQAGPADSGGVPDGSGSAHGYPAAAGMAGQPAAAAKMAGEGEVSAIDGPHLPIELPELVEFSRQLGQGKYPQVRESIRLLRGTALGAFYSMQSVPDSGHIQLRADLFGLVPPATRKQLKAEAKQYAEANPDPDRGLIEVAAEKYDSLLDEAEQTAMKSNPALASNVLAHEIGHWIDFLPEGMIRGRGNILGRIASLKKFTANLIGATPAEVDKTITQRERKEIRNRAAKLARFSLPKGSSKETVAAETKKIYRTKVDELVQSRGLVTRGEIVEELNGLIAWWHNTDTIPEYFTKPSEMYADAFSVMMNNPAAVKQRAPKYYDLFFSYLESNPAAKRNYDRIQKDITMERVQGERDKLQMKRHQAADAAAQTFEEELNKLSFPKWRESMLIAIDRRFAPIYSRVKKAKGYAGEKAAKVRKGIADYLYHKGQHKLYLARMDGEALDVLRNANVSFPEFNMYLENQHIVNNRTDIASMGGMNPHAAQQSLDAQRKRLGETQWTAMENAEAARWKIRQELVLDPLQESGILDPEMMTVLRSRVKYSTVSAVDIESDPVSQFFKTTFGGEVSSKIHRQVGYLGAAKSPMLATAQKDLSLITTLNTQSMRKDIAEFLAAIGDPSFRVAEMSWDQNTKRQIPKIVDNSLISTVLYLDGGKIKGFYTSKSMADMLERNDAQDVTDFVKIVRRPIQALKSAWTSLNYGFWPFNYIRDRKGFAKRMPGVYSRVFGKNAYARYAGRATEAAKSIAANRPNALAQSALKRNMLIHTSQWNVDADAQYDAFEKLIKMHDVDPKAWGIKESKAKTVTRSMWQKYTAIGELIEREIKIAGMLHLDEKYPNMPEAEKQRMVHEFAGSPNFMERGTMNWFIDFCFPFYNPAKQGYRSAWHAAQERPGEWMLKTMKYSVMPKLVIAGLAKGLFEALIGRDRSEEMKQMYESISEYDRTNYDCIPIGWADKATGKVIYWRGVEEEEERVAGGIMSQMLDGNVDLSDLLNFAAGQLPGLNPFLKVGSVWGDYWSGRQPTDRGTPIIDRNRFAAGEGKEAMLKWTANQLGAGLVVRFNRDNFYDPTPTMLEKFLELPVISNTLGRFLRVSNRGLTEKARGKLKPIEKADAQRRLRVQEVIDGQEMTPERLEAIMSPEGQKYMKNAVEEKSAQEYMDPFAYKLLKSRSNPKRTAAMMSD